MRSNSPSFIADRIYALANWDPGDPPGPGVLLRSILGKTAARPCHERPNAIDARLFMRDEGWRVLVPTGLSGAALAMALARVLARWYALTQGDETATPDIDGIAAAIVLPDAAIPRAVTQFGRDPRAIADWLVLPQPVVADRLGDVAPPSRSGLYMRTETPRE